MSKSATREQEVEDTIARTERGEHTPCDIVCEMEGSVIAVADYAEVLSMLGCDPALATNAGAAITRVARDLKSAISEVEEWRENLFDALHPNRNDPDFADVEAARRCIAEVEEAAEA